MKMLASAKTAATAASSPYKTSRPEENFIHAPVVRSTTSRIKYRDPANERSHDPGGNKIDSEARG